MHVIHTCRFDCPCHEQSQRPRKPHRRKTLGGWDGNLFRLVWSMRRDALRAKHLARIAESEKQMRSMLTTEQNIIEARMIYRSAMQWSRGRRPYATAYMEAKS